jgi:hypothetical protein
MKAEITEIVRKHRTALRASRLNPVQDSFHDSPSASFRLQCERECLFVASHPGDPLESDTLNRIGEIADPDGWV